MYNRYSEYKSSGIEWIGQVPVVWTNKRLKYLARLVNEKGIPEVESFSVNLEHIESWTGRLISGEAVDQEPSEEEMKQFKAGDVLFNKLRPYLAKVYRTESDGVCGGELLVLRPQSENMQSGFLFYRLLSKDFISVVDGSTYGTKMPRASWDFIGNLRVAYPETQEQEKISDFLDTKIGKIDDLITKKEGMIELLKEERAAVINQAVTKGLDPKVEMKDSGVGWIGKIPKHWCIKRLASFGRFSKGGGFSKSDLVDEGLSAILYGDIYTKYDHAVNKVERKISKESAQGSVRIGKGDLLFTGSGETVEDIGKCVVLNLNEDVFAGGDVIIFRQQKHYSLFLSYCLNTNGVRGEKAKCAKGEIIVHIYASDLRDLRIPIPPNEEQKAIVDFLNRKIAQIDGQVAREGRLIELLKEYRTALISEVVTGKIDIRN